MANTKISALSSASTPLDGTEVLPIVQSGSTKKVANNDLRPKQIQSNATSGVMQIVGPAAAATRVMTIPDANFTVARTDAGQTFTGDQAVTGALSATTTLSFSPTITATQVASTGGIASIKAVSYSSFVELVAGGSSWSANYMGAGEGGLMMQGAAAAYGMRLNIYNSTNPTFKVTYGTTNVFSTDSSGNMTIAQGNIVQGTAAKGINFTANTPAAGMTSQLLNWYEQGTWTCTLKGSVADPTTPVTATGNYTRIGRLVQFHVAFVNVTTTGASGAITFNGLPFTSANVDNHMVTAGVFQGATFTNNVAAFVGGNATSIQLKSLVSNGAWTNVTHNAGAGAYFWLSGVYFV